jgi:hypothetical protein
MSNVTIRLDEVPADWPGTVREIAVRTGQAVRAGANNTIEVKSLTTNRWCILQLPGGGGAFVTAADRDAVLAKITNP